MPQKIDSTLLDWDKIPEDECQHNTLNSSWTTTSKNKGVTVVQTLSNMAFNYNFCVPVTAHPQGSTNNSKQIDIDDYHPLLRSSTDGLSLYGAFPEPHFNTHRLDILEKLSEYLDLNFN